ncbi:MAG TPA: AraC family transcriptional regulator [Ignavibacteriaceae bacterium]|nr:AraC family transcriptional regulator [Ignavibacteriaceae bacterium]
MQISVTDIIAITATFQLLIFSFFLLSLKRGNRINHLLLAAFLFTNAMYIIGYLLFAFSENILPAGVHFFFIGTSFGFLFGPLLLLYTKSLVQSNFQLKKKDLLHTIPFIIYNLLYSIYFHFKPTDLKMEMLHQGNVLPHLVGFWVSLLMNVQILIYMAVTLFILMDYSKRIKSMYSTIHHLNLGWLELVLYAFLAMWLIDFAHFLIRNNIGISPEVSGYLTLISITINFVFANLVIYRGLKQPYQFFVIEKELPKTKSDNNMISDEESNIYLEKLLAYMSAEKPYLISTLTIKELSERLEINPRILSRIINEKKHQNFFDFINSYRIDDAKMILSNPAKRKMTILEILYDVGFNSKSVFNTTFKKYTGATPTEYRKNYLRHFHHTIHKSA